jgi:hypothetical protein
MPNKKLLEEYPLYRKMTGVDFMTLAARLPKPAIHMECNVCKSHQTFNMVNEYYEGAEIGGNSRVGGQVCRLRYRCSHCADYYRSFLVAFDEKFKWVMKVGQFPAWDITGEPNVERMLGAHSEYYKRGLICESQGYGIGAFGYYRRIVEEIIDSLLDDIAGLLVGEELTKYQEALGQTRKTTVTQEKIALVKDLLPAILRPDGMNPLSALHSALSQGLHAESDEECLDYAEAVNGVLIFLVNQVALNSEAKKQFTAGMKKLLDRKGKNAAVAPI